MDGHWRRAAIWPSCFAPSIAGDRADGSSTCRRCRTSATRNSITNCRTRALTFPDAGYQLLALYRFWNIIEYWFPYRDLLDEDWDKVLAEFIPRIALAKDKNAYQLETLALIARVTDTHANLWSAPPRASPASRRAASFPCITRFIERPGRGHRILGATAGPATGLQIGDVIEIARRHAGAGTGQALGAVLSRVEPADAAARHRARDDARRLRARRASASVAPAGAVEITAQRQPLASLDRQAGITHDLAGRHVPAALRSGRVSEAVFGAGCADADSYIDALEGHAGLIIDIRNYPSEFVVVRAGLAARRSAHAVRAVYRRRSRQSRRLPLARQPAVADAAAAALSGQGRRPRR